MSETKWRGACEYLGIEYDEIIADLDHPAEARETEPERENKTEKKDNEEIRGGTMPLKLTEKQCRAMIDMIESYLLDIIRTDTEIDNLEWVESLLGAKHAMQQAVEAMNHDPT